MPYLIKVGELLMVMGYCSWVETGLVVACSGCLGEGKFLTPLSIWRNGTDDEFVSSVGIKR